MVKIVNIVGARPQFIKYSPVARELQKYNKHFKDILIHTGQHYDYQMSKIFFDELGIKTPDYHLGVGSHSHGKQTALMIEKIEEVLLKEKPEIVIIYGDTNSTLAGAIAASKLDTLLMHVEAGLRSKNREMPEEINRIITDHSSDILLCPSKTAVSNLIQEGFPNVVYEGSLVPCDYFSIKNMPDFKIDKNTPLVINTGDIMYDVLLYVVEKSLAKSRILDRLNLIPHDYYVLTLHRAETTDNQKRLEEMIHFVNEISSNKRIIFPIHPRTKKAYQSSRVKFNGNVKIIDPVSYLDMVA